MVLFDLKQQHSCTIISTIPLDYSGIKKRNDLKWEKDTEKIKNTLGKFYGRTYRHIQGSPQKNDSYFKRECKPTRIPIVQAVALKK